MSAELDSRAQRVLPDDPAVARHDRAVFDLRLRRDAAVAQVPDWEALREQAERVKAYSLDHLGDLLERFEERARAAGAHVHWAADAAALGRISAEILAARGARRVVKSKSMLTEECGLNPFLAKRGIDVVDTDLGERIVQLGQEPPSHIIVPAVHRTRQQIGALFHQHMGSPEGEEDPQRLTRFAREDLRRRFLAADAAITGVNFGVAETGSIVVVTNEGNADLGMSLPSLHIACMGIEKLIPRMEDLPVFLRILARSATGQPLSAYTSIVTGPASGSELHLVVVDNGRSSLLANARHRSALSCIRCGACLNTCPVYRHAGGHAYATPVPGPIGAVLAPALAAGDANAAALPFASSLCGSCTAVCPVRIDLHDQLLAWRRERPTVGRLERLWFRLAAFSMLRPRMYRRATRLLSTAWPLLRRRFPGHPAAGWLQGREFPERPAESFASWYQRERGGTE